ncbi:hypothetical protein N2384_00255 [Bacillus paralicheniformis]|nr:hypothetical protein [Bacillus paralicheniformis]UWS61854.1 hypothetical protein N2384_00255 [Bacillus paralicheniformis]
MRDTDSLTVTATIGACGRYFAIIRAVWPLSVGVTIAAALRLIAVCATDWPIASVIVMPT